MSGEADRDVVQLQDTATPALLAQVTLALPISAVLFVAICLLRRWFPLIYAPRIKLSRFRPPPLSGSYLKWLWELIFVDEETVFQKAGLDAFMVVRIFRLLALYFGGTAIFNLLVILPLHATQEEDPENPEKTDLYTLARLPSNSPRFIAHACLGWVFGLSFLALLFREFWVLINFKYNRYFPRLVAEQPSSWCSLFVVHVPESLRSPQKLKDLFGSLGFPVKRVTFTTWDSDVDKRLKKRAKHLNDLETLVDKFAGNRVRDPEKMKAIRVLRRILDCPSQDTSFKSIESRGNILLEDSIRLTMRDSSASSVVPATKEDLSYNDTEELRKDVQNCFKAVGDQVLVALDGFITEDKALKEARVKALSDGKSSSDEYPQNAFVTFEDVRSCFIISQAITDSNPGHFHTELISEPNNVYWPNVWFGFKQRTLRKFAVESFFVAMTLAWVFPIVAVNGLLNLEELEKVGVLKGIINLSPAVRGLIKGILPTLALKLFFALVPMIITMLAKQKGTVSFSGIENDILTKLSTFFFFNLFLFNTFIGTVAQFVPDLLERGLSGSASFIVSQILESFRISLPNLAPLFVNYVCYSAFVSQVVRFLRLGPLIFYVLRKRRILNGSPRALNQQIYPESYPFGLSLAEPIIVAVVAQTYVLFTPFMSIFAFFYFIIAMMIAKYNLLYVFRRRFDQGGNLFLIFFQYAMIGLVFQQFMMILVLAFNKAAGSSTSLIPLLFITVIAWALGSRIVVSRIRTVPLRNMVKAIDKRLDSDVVTIPVGGTGISPEGAGAREKRPGGGEHVLAEGVDQHRDSDDNDGEVHEARLRSQRELADPHLKMCKHGEKELGRLGDPRDRQPAMSVVIPGTLQDDWWVHTQRRHDVFRHPTLVGSLPAFWPAADKTRLSSSPEATEELDGN